MKWPLVRLADVAAIVGGATPLRARDDYWKGDIPWVTPTDLPKPGNGIAAVSATKDRITELGLSSCSAQVLPVGTVLFSSRATIGKVGIASVPLTTNQGFANFIPRDHIDARFLAYSLLVNTQSISALSGKTTFKEVTKSVLRNYRILLPPLSEQRRIVEILDQADALRKKRAEADAKAERILPALFYRMFGDPVRNEKGWPLKRFDEVCESRLGKMLDAKQQTGEHKRPYLRNANVQWDRLDLTQVHEMDFGEADRQEFRLQKGDLLICEGGEVGRCAIWNDELPECYFQKAIHRVRPRPGEAVPEYLVHLLWQLARSGGLSDSTSQLTIAHLTGVKLKQMLIPLPPLALQKSFARVVQSRRSTSDGQTDLTERLDTLHACLLHRAFTGDLTAKWRGDAYANVRGEHNRRGKTAAQ